MRFIYIILFILSINFQLISQQQNQYTQASLNKYAINPAFAGLDFSLSANLMYRNQWEGIQNNPSDIHLNAHIPFYVWSGAVGGIIERQSYGVFDETSIAGSYNYVQSTPFGLLSFGARLGITNLKVYGDRIITPEGDYGGVLSHNDPLLLESLDQGIAGRWEIGTYFYSKNIEGGFSFSHLPESKIKLDRTTFGKTTHVNAYFQYNYKLREDIELMQSILLKTDFNEIQSDISSIFKINGNIFGGINLRGYSSQSLDAMAFIFGMKLGEHYTLSYSYDLGLSGVRRAHEGTHEILLNYNLRKLIGSGQPPKIIYNPRYL